MKLFILTFFATFIGFGSKAQNVNEAKQQVYYQHYNEAKQLLSAAIKNDSANGEAWYWMARVLLKQKKADEAFQVMSRATMLTAAGVIPKKEIPLVNTGYAQVLLEKGQKEEAQKIIADALGATGYKDADILLAAAQANIETENGDASLALQLLEKAVKKDKHNASIYLAMGEAYRKMADGGNAVLSYEAARKENPLLAETWYREGLIYKTQQNEDVLLDRFTKAYNTDSAYAPALYQLYSWYYFKDVQKAATFLDAYIRHAEPGVSHLYMKADLAFVSQQYPAALEWVQKIISAEKDAAQPRIYKLAAYSYAAIKDSAAAFSNMNTYFINQDTAGLVAKDYVLMAKLLESRKEDSSAAGWYIKAIAAETDKNERLNYMITLADLEKQQNRRGEEAKWREEIYNVKSNPTNLDIYKWGTALYAAQEYKAADSVFAIYEEKYPDQLYGYLWRARSNALMDTSMMEGLAIPHYQKLVEVAARDSVKNRAVLLNAYGYLGTYEANIKKDYPASLQYFTKMLSIDPANDDAVKFTAMLKKWMSTGN